MRKIVFGVSAAAALASAAWLLPTSAQATVPGNPSAQAGGTATSNGQCPNIQRAASGTTSLNSTAGLVIRSNYSLPCRISIISSGYISLRLDFYQAHGNHERKS
jgi:hypothetical protein